VAQPQRIVLERRAYNQWVANQTLEDYALRFTATRARKGSFRIANTALGAISFLACEAIGGSITLTYGFSNVAAAIMVVGVLSFLLGLPIAFHAARAGVDVDLLTRGGGFGYLGSTITSLIYASFTFVLFAIEASIMSMALKMVFGIPLPIAHIISSIVVIPIAAYGIRYISRMQLATQPIWLVLQIAPLAYIALRGGSHLGDWTHFTGALGAKDGSISLPLFGAAASILLSLLPQVCEQVDYLRFLPVRTAENRRGWWWALISTGPGWVAMGSFKLLAGSFLAYLALRQGLGTERATQPAELYHFAFMELFHSPAVALALTGLFVIVCQLKINVTNAYSGSIAWSNFFSRLTHSHPGRVVWLVFNVLVALMLMETNIFRSIGIILGLYASFAVGWLGALTADLIINKPLGLSPAHIEFKRAHLYDINPVGVGAMGTSILVSTSAFLGFFGASAQALSAFIGLAVALVAAPAIAWATKGKYYIARQSHELTDDMSRCSVCENTFERDDMAFCSAYGAPICSLCCSLEARCRDQCKTKSRVADQIASALNRLLPDRFAAFSATRLGQFSALFVVFAGVAGGLFALIYVLYADGMPTPLREVVGDTLWIVFLTFLVLSGIAAWLLVLAHESRRTAEQESEKQTATLIEEIAAHKRTDAALQKTKEAAEAANFAKSRYIVGLSHEFRTPLNSIYGYAQLLERDPDLARENPVRVIRRSAEHLSNLVDGLLDISRVETGILHLKQTKFHLPDLLTQMADMFRIQASGRGIEFRYHCDPGIPQYVVADDKRLRQILINLLSNAIKYTKQGHASLEVRRRNHVTEFVISDSGMGILPEDMETIFHPFERGGMAHARAIPGTGLGLTITRLLTKAMGGDLTVTSTPGEGSCFTVRMLLFAAMPEPRDESLGRNICGYIGERVSILIADDNPAHLDLVHRTLSPLGFAVRIAQHGADAVERAAESPPDIAILDITMPGLTGWEVAAQLRLMRPQMKIMMVSGNAHDFQSVDQEGAIHDAFLIKPFTIQSLLESVQLLCRREWIYEAPPRPPDQPAREAPVRAMPSGTRFHVEQLIHLGQIGYVHGIYAKLAELEAENVAYMPMTSQARTYVQQFQFDDYFRFLKAYRA
jgi:signal transduction histidine kinase/ActR/RegA family two-component response regulator